MHEAEIRARIRERLKSGLPAGAVNMQFGVISGATCLACGEADPTIMYTYPSGPVVRGHDACGVIWQEEREPAVAPAAGGSGDRVETKEASMNNPVFAWIVIGAGFLVDLIARFADPLGPGSSPDFGWIQILGVAVGVLVVVAGVYLWRRGTVFPGN